MNTNDKRRELCHWLSHHFKFEPSEFLKNGALTFKSLTNLEIEISIDSEAKNVFLTGTLGSLREGEQKNILKKAMKMNLYKAETREAHLAYDDQYDTLLVQWDERLERLTDVSFANCLANFIETTNSLYQKIFSDESPKDSVGPQASMFMLKV